MRPAPAEWLLPHGLNRTNVDAVHPASAGPATTSGRCLPATRQQALQARRQRVPACVHCRPATDLGILDWPRAGCQVTGRWSAGSRWSAWTASPQNMALARADADRGRGRGQPCMAAGCAAEPKREGTTLSSLRTRTGGCCCAPGRART
ncbi:DUF6233 domain-containing protein [Streptomyces sp. NPDC053069]|uniref:DUF6233 domain-containing protein n=1 Tax=Streptomyces sp. NPDC053069 TaxID=3365695 RepID=UPI0037D4C9AA